VFSILAQNPSRISASTSNIYKNLSIRRPGKNCNGKGQETILLVLDDRLVMTIDQQDNSRCIRYTNETQIGALFDTSIIGVDATTEIIKNSSRAKN
jgi:hypothetical protein